MTKFLIQRPLVVKLFFSSLNFSFVRTAADSKGLKYILSHDIGLARVASAIRSGYPVLAWNAADMR